MSSERHATTAREMPSAIRERVMRVLDWTFPPRPVDREIISRVPDDSDLPPILFVHGMGHAAWCWDEHWMEELCDRGWPCHAVSLRGHGESGGRESRGRSTIRHYVHDVMQAIVGLDQRPVLVGHSMGALPVMRVLETYPARAGVLMTPVAADHGLSMGMRIAREMTGNFFRALIGRPFELTREMLFSDELDDQTARRYLAKLDPAVPLNQYEMLLPRSIEASKAPTLVLGSRDDALIPVEDVERTAELYDADLQMFDHIGHSMMLDVDWREPLDVTDEWLRAHLEETAFPTRDDRSSQSVASNT